MPSTAMRSSVLAGVGDLALLALGVGTPGARGAASATAAANAHTVTLLVADAVGRGPELLRNRANAWGLMRGPTSPWWVAKNGTNTSTLYRGKRPERRAGRPGGRRADRYGLQRRAELRRQ